MSIHSHHHCTNWRATHPFAEPEPRFNGYGVARGVLAGLVSWCAIMGAVVVGMLNHG